MTVREHPGSEGWYPDPSGRHAQRYFDGTVWTDHVVSKTGEQRTDIGVSRGLNRTNDWGWSLAVLVMFGLLIVAYFVILN